MQMSKRSNLSSLVAVAVVAAAGIAAYMKRPVKPPEQAGAWRPAESQRTRRP